MLPQRLREKIKRWWQGEYIPPPRDNPNSPVIIVSIGFYRRHWTARAVSAIFAFVAHEWKWLIPVLLTLAGLIIAAIKL